MSMEDLVLVGGSLAWVDMLHNSSSPCWKFVTSVGGEVLRSETSSMFEGGVGAVEAVLGGEWLSCTSVTLSTP